LLLLCVLLIVWSPVQLGLVVSNTLAALPVRGATLGLLLVARVVVAAFGIAAGLALLTRRAPALMLARTSLVATAAADLFAYLTPYLVTAPRAMNGSTPPRALATRRCGSRICNDRNACGTRSNDGLVDRLTTTS
jgi:hypothetical protein